MLHLLFLFFLFAKISLLTFGGGYAMIPLFQNELVDRLQYITPEEFANLVTLAQMTPGPIGLNSATFIGYQQGWNYAGPAGGILGAFIATAGVAFPSFVLVTLVYYFLETFRKNSYIEAILQGVRPATIGLIFSAVIFFADISVFQVPLHYLWSGLADSFRLCWPGAIIFSAVLFVQWKWKKVSMFYLLGGSAVAAILLFRIF